VEAIWVAGNDGMDDAAAPAQLYPQYDFAALPRRACGTNRTPDVLDLGLVVH